MLQTQFLMLSYVNTAVLIAAFIYGVVNVLVKKGASYFKFYVCAVGCYALAELLRLTYYLCYGEQAELTGMFSIGYFGCFLFALSACRKPFDSIVDDRSKTFRKYRVAAIFAPAIIVVLTFFSYFPVRASLSDRAVAVIVLLSLPKLAASYYNFKHLIMPDMGYGFIKNVRLCNIFALLMYVVDSFYTYAAVVSNRAFVLAGGLVLNVCCIGLIAAAKRGMKLWKA